MKTTFWPELLCFWYKSQYLLHPLGGEEVEVRRPQVLDQLVGRLKKCAHIPRQIIFFKEDASVKLIESKNELSVMSDGFQSLWTNESHALYRRSAHSETFVFAKIWIEKFIIRLF